MQFRSVNGIFYRAIDPIYKDSVIAGSRLAGRYSDQSQPTLYLSATQEGMAAAIDVHKENRAASQQIVQVHVRGGGIFDLRDEALCRAANVELKDAIAPWQHSVAQGK